MMSASPPPMMEDDDLDEDLSYEDELDLSDVPDFVPGDIGDDEEQDVTGMSSKLHTIPKEAIHLAPKDVRIPTKADDAVKLTNGTEPSDIMEPVEPLDLNPISETVTTKPESPILTEKEELKSDDEVMEDDQDEQDLEIPNKELESETKSVNDSFADFGDFESAFPQESENQSDIKDDVPEDQDRDENNLDNDDDDDDEFGEFTDFSEPPTIPNESSLSEEPSLDSMQCILNSLQPMISQVISRLFESEDGDNPVIEAKEPLNFSKDHMDDEIWEQICDIQSTPALRQSWTKSQSHSGWLQSIRIDPNNMVFETRHRLRGSSPSVPAFATGMGLLEPIRVSNPESQTLKTVTTPDSLETSIPEQLSGTTEIPPVQFDWQTSGLTNPLDTGAQMRSPNTQRRPPPTELHAAVAPPLEPLPQMEDPVVTKENSPKSAQKILGSFPLLDFMQASALARPSASPVSMSNGKPQEFLASFAQ